jgi:hypothetical protein
MRTLQFGIEIETVGINRHALALAIHNVVAGAPGSPTMEPDGSWRATDIQGRAWRVVRDGSLSCGENSGEIVSPVLGYDDIELLQQIVRAVRAAGARADETTGIHIHVGARQFDAKSIANLVKTVHKQERLLEHALGVSERRLARYCRPIDPAFLERLEAHPPRTLQDVSAAWYGRHNANPSRYDSSRYHGLNLNSFFFRGTIEFRYFNGTLHAGAVKAYVQFVLALAAKALRAKTASSKRREFNVATAKYDWRVFLVSHLRLIGDEFKTARLHLTKHLAGSAAWKGERRDRRPHNEPQTAPQAPAPDGSDHHE